MLEMGEPWELVLVDDGSTDGSTQAIRDLARKDRRVRPVIFARNFGHQIAITAGWDYARGEAVIIIDADLQDPPEAIPELVRKWRKVSMSYTRFAPKGRGGLVQACQRLAILSGDLPHHRRSYPRGYRGLSTDGSQGCGRAQDHARTASVSAGHVSLGGFSAGRRPV